MALKKTNNSILGVVNRDVEAGERLAFELGCPFLTDFHSIPEAADIVIIAVADDAISEVASQIFCPGKIVAHTSGTQSMDVLRDASDRLGVFYPLQTMHRSGTVDMESVPFCVEANSNWGEGALMELASSISGNVHLVNSSQRKLLHLAAVIACNFSNHFYGLANDILGKDGLDISMLYPLIQQTAENVKNGNPHGHQTGPAVRGDVDVMNRHLRVLKSIDPKVAELYKAVSASIASKKS
jgi:predicted short-subunit dehydrogenase-like oxidoreductase (DUF2520 family)